MFAAFLRTWSYPKMEINTATEDFTVSKLHFAGDSHPTIHFCMCSLAFTSSDKQPDIIKVNINTHCQITEKPRVFHCWHGVLLLLFLFLSPPSLLSSYLLFFSHLCDSLLILSEALRSFPPEFCGNLDVWRNPCEKTADEGGETETKDNEWLWGRRGGTVMVSRRRCVDVR